MNIPTVPANNSPRTAGLIWAFTLAGWVYGPFGGRGGDGVKEWFWRIFSGAMLVCAHRRKRLDWNIDMRHE